LRQNLLKRKKRGLRSLLAIVSKEFGAAEEELTGGGRRRILAAARSVFCHLATRELGATGRQLSEMLQITPAAVFYSIERGERILEKDDRLQENVKNYLNNLTPSPWVCSD
jgi:chromosomal replication initiation ATPase DnaA